MRIRTLALTAFMNHENSRLDFPDRGIVLVRGLNGSGKSALVEAVSTASWGRTLRGTPPWRDGAAGSAVVETDRFAISRSRNAKGVLSLEWRRLDSDAFSFDTTTIAQTELEREIGTFDVWRRTHVFSTQDVAHFTLATDAERKRLIEVLLGASQFDAALELCRTDKKTNDGLVTKAEKDAAVTTAKLEGVQQRRADAEQTIAITPATRPTETPPDTEALKTRDAKLQGMIEAAAADITEAAAALREIDREIARAEAAVGVAQKRAAFFQQDKCPTCEQALPAHKRNEASQELARAQQNAREVQRAAVASRAAKEAEVEEFEEEKRGLREQREQVKAELAAAQAEVRRIAQANQEAQRIATQQATARKVVEQVKADLAELEKKSQKVNVGLEQARAEAAEIAATEKVLGLQGFRAQVLAGALGGIESVANRWLAEIAGPGFALTLRPYSEKKKGGVNDKISLDVTGAGGGYGYKASSGGERRRIDVALLLALAEVASAAQGDETGTLWFDEPFDTLDDDGIAAVGRTIGELAEERAVVVITHSGALAVELRPVLRLNVRDGGVEALREQA